MKSKVKNQKNQFLKISIVLAIFVVVIGALYFNMSSGKDEVVAKVNGQKIYRSELNAKLGEMFQNVSPEELAKEDVPGQVMEILVKDIYVQKQISKKARRSGVSRQEQVKKEINELTDKVLRKAYLEKAAKDKVTEQAIKDKYVELVDSVQDKKEIEIKHIMVKTKKEARSISARLRSGYSFEKLAKKHSIDEGSGKNGGSLGYIIEDSLPAEFQTALKKMKKGSVSSPLQTNYGWHIIKRGGTRDAKAAEFDEVKEALADQMRREEMKKIVSDLTKDADIKILVNKSDDSESQIDQSGQAEDSLSQNSQEPDTGSSSVKKDSNS